MRNARTSRKLTQRKLAEILGRKASDSGLIARWESGERAPRDEDIAKMIDELSIEGDEATNLVALASGATKSQWLAVTLPERRQQLNALLAAESTATKVTHVAPLLIPGVLQTREVIRAIMVDGDVPAEEIDERIYMRIGRRDLITRNNPAHLDVLLDEGVIRHVIGSRKIMADQLRYLLELGAMPNVELRVVPFTASWTPLLTGPFILIDSDQAPSIVSLDLHASGLMLQAPDDIATYRRQAEAVREKAMSPADTAELIAEVMTELEMLDDDTP